MNLADGTRAVAIAAGLQATLEGLKLVEYLPFTGDAIRGAVTTWQNQVDKLRSWALDLQSGKRSDMDRFLKSSQAVADGMWDAHSEGQGEWSANLTKTLSDVSEQIKAGVAAVPKAFAIGVPVLAVAAGAAWLLLGRRR